MRVPFGWLRELVPVPFPLEDVAHRLTMAGFEVEEVVEVDGAPVMEVHVNANRGDALSMVGIAREVAALTRDHVKATSAFPGCGRDADFPHTAEGFSFTHHRHLL